MLFWKKFQIQMYKIIWFIEYRELTRCINFITFQGLRYSVFWNLKLFSSWNVIFRLPTFTSRECASHRRWLLRWGWGRWLRLRSSWCSGTRRRTWPSPACPERWLLQSKTGFWADLSSVWRWRRARRHPSRRRCRTWPRRKATTDSPRCSSNRAHLQIY